ncbi:MAG: phosphate acetyltransferase [Propionibacteriaceae bacterium]|nr:phosphate acetyltransferase [Propionibacteriaceae bacterium]
MTKSVYVLAPEALVGKSAVALGAVAAFRDAGRRVGVFRPIIRTEGLDSALESLLESADSGQTYEQGYGATYAEVREDTESAVTTIIDRYQSLQARFDAVVILGSDYSDVISATEYSLNAEIAAHLNTPALLVVSARGASASDLLHAVEFARRQLTHSCTPCLGVVAMGLDSASIEEYDQALAQVDLPVLLTVPGHIVAEVALPATFAQTVSQIHCDVRTPLAFQYELMCKARADKRTIVLPESEDDRILRSASILLHRDIANLILLGDADTIHARAAELGVDLSKAKIQSMDDPALTADFAEEYARLRAHKGVTIDQARETLRDVSYFGTMMIHQGLADGMVSGAIHTTAHTIRPSLEFIKTMPGITMVSGYFLMCLADRVLVFADCAVTPNPTPENLAEIAIASAATAASFGIEPRVALLSYSTGTSGTGPDVDMVAEATRILRERAPQLPTEGPIQFDAAVDEVVAKTKLPGSTVAGHATVFIFPDLNTGNTTYKAVQRTANALAIGPVLQGLRKPVNDLSRGALVDDIVNTVAITAIQAQADPAVPF